MSGRIGGVGRGVVASLICARIVYGLNWFSLAAVFSLTAAELNENVSGLGLITATFYLGVGIFQVPGGILAAKIGPRLTAIYGTTFASLAGLLIGFTNSLAEIAVLRFLVGLGMALVFAPGVVLITKFVREGSEGLGVGLYNTAFYLGGVIGLSGWALLAGAIGWRNSLIASGSLGLLTSVLMWISMPKDSRHQNFKVDPTRLKFILLNKWLIVLAIALAGLGVGTTIMGNFMTYYLESVIHIGVGEAGTIASLVLLSALMICPFSGRLFDRSGNAKRLLFTTGALMTIAVGLAFLGTIHVAVLCLVIVGLASGAGTTIAFSTVRATKTLDREYETMAVSLVNSISLFSNFVPPLLFSYLAIRQGYSLAGLCLAALVFILTIPVLLLNTSQKNGSVTTRLDV